MKFYSYCHYLWRIWCFIIVFCVDYLTEEAQWLSIHNEIVLTIGFKISFVYFKSNSIRWKLCEIFSRISIWNKNHHAACLLFPEIVEFHLKLILNNIWTTCPTLCEMRRWRYGVSSSNLGDFYLSVIPCQVSWKEKRIKQIFKKRSEMKNMHTNIRLNSFTHAHAHININLYLYHVCPWSLF